MVKLSILGPAELRDQSGVLAPSFLSGPKRLAVLAYLALNTPQGYQRRDALLPLFWPNQDQQSARNALSNMLYHIRSSLGSDVIINRGKEEIGLKTIWCDVHAFEEAISKGNLKDAQKLYRGSLLEGLHVPGTSVDFQQWLDNERARLGRSYKNLLEKLAREAESQKDFESAANRWYRLIREDPYGTTAIRHLMEMLLVTGKRKEAISVAEEHARILEDELGADATEELEKLQRFLYKAERKLDEEPFLFSGEKSDPDPRTIAVIPFSSLGSKGDDDPFAAGLHYDLLSRLYKIPSLTVIARNSLLHFQNKKRSIPEIVNELGAGMIIEGTVQHSNQEIRLHIQLTDAGREQIIWADTFDRKLDPSTQFELQGELAEIIIEKLKKRMRSMQHVVTTEEPVTDIETYHLNVQAQTYLAKRTEAGIQQALKYFQKAIGRDPSYAAAWAGLAEGLLLLNYYAYTVPEGYPEISTAAEKALALGSELADSHVAIGIWHASSKKGPEAVKAFEKAIELQPGSAKAHNWLGWLYMILGKPKQAIEPGERAAELNPLAPYVRAYLAEIYLAAGFYDKALTEACTARQMQPEMTLTHFLEGLSLYHLGRYSESLLALDEARLLVQERGTPSESEVMAVRALTHLAERNRMKAEELLEELTYTDDQCSTAVVLAALGKTDEAISLFTGTRDWNDFATPFIRYFFPDVLKPIREDKKFEKIIGQVNQSWGLSQFN